MTAEYEGSNSSPIFLSPDLNFSMRYHRCFLLSGSNSIISIAAREAARELAGRDVSKM